MPLLLRQGPLDAALATPEIDWSAPRPDGWIMGGGWGSQRVVMFAGVQGECRMGPCVCWMG
jgi:hypothetical protein